jgi:hypothetical protein
MAKATVALGVRVEPDVMEALKCQSAISGWSQAQIITHLVLGLHTLNLSRFTLEERARYEQLQMSRVEFKEICRRRRDAPASNVTSLQPAYGDAA